VRDGERLRRAGGAGRDAAPQSGREGIVPRSQRGWHAPLLPRREALPAKEEVVIVGANGIARASAPSSFDRSCHAHSSPLPVDREKDDLRDRRNLPRSAVVGGMSATKPGTGLSNGTAASGFRFRLGRL